VFYMHAKILKHSLVKLLDNCFIDRIELRNEAGTGCDSIVCFSSLSAVDSLDYI
jgi:hypothetical protein